MREMRSVIERVKEKYLKVEEEYVELVNEVAREIIERAREICSNVAIPMFCGSFAKGTWLKPVEFDLFLLFDEHVDLEREGLELCTRIARELGMEFEKKYAEHPYIHGVYRSFEVDIVPCYKVESAEKIKSSVDRTPFHVKFVVENLREEQKDDVRLLKLFLKANDLYGADVATHGFSGYLCELLIIKFGSFENLVKEASNWAGRKVIYFFDSHKPSKKMIRERFYDQPLIVIDPVDKNRNVAAAVSAESYLKFIMLCRSFVESPSEEFFEKEKGEGCNVEEEIKRRGSKVVCVELSIPHDIHRDIFVSQVKRFERILRAHLSNYGFPLHRAMTVVEEKSCFIFFEFSQEKIGRIAKKIGPVIFNPSHFKEFVEKYRNSRIWVENNRLVAEVERRFTEPVAFIKNIVDKCLNELPRYVAREIASGNFRILEKFDEEVVRRAACRFLRSGLYGRETR
jgi:tRNA nucleotidyltransferase (CCA-adding enzyme)